MNKKIKAVIIKALLGTAIFNFAVMNTEFSRSLLNGQGIAYAVQADEVVIDGSIYSEEAEYYQCCLNKLGYKDNDNNVLEADGQFGENSKIALNKFLSDQGFAYFSYAAKDKLMSLAENTANAAFDSGFTPGADKLKPSVFIYSSISNVNNSNDPFYSMSVLKEFPYTIIESPMKMTYKSKRVAEFIKTRTKIFGYVNLGPDNPTDEKSLWKRADLNTIKGEIDTIASAGWYGVFVDQFGYDYNETRERQNIIVDYIHGKGLVCMANAWFPDDALGSEIDSDANPLGIPAHLSSSDWYLVESFFSDGTSYRGDKSYIEKYLKIKQYRDSMKINIAVLAYKRDSITWQQAADDVKNSYILAQCLGFNSWWFGKTDNSDDLLYGKEPNIDLGKLIKPLQLQSGNKYVAETEKYKIEYYAQSIPMIKLTEKKQSIFDIIRNIFSWL